MRIIRQSPCYCSECDAPDSLKVRFQNKLVVQNGSIALCLKHAAQLSSMLTQHVRREQLRRTQAAAVGMPDAASSTAGDQHTGSV